MAEIQTSLPIIVGCNQRINHMAFDGCHYYCTMKCQCEIIKLDQCFHKIYTFSTCRVYDCICYDFGKHCFWASSQGCRNRLFQLDCEMCEIDCMEIQDIRNQGEITGVSYNCCQDALLVSYPCHIYEVQKPCGKAKVLYTSKKDWLLGVSSLCPGMLAIVLKDKCYAVEVFDGCNKKIRTYPMKGCICPRDIRFNPCTGNSHCLMFDLFIRNKLGYPHMLRCGVCPQELGFTPCPCNYNICDQCCDAKNACVDVMESIALVETALSHILNAEGEKIQKALATTDDLDKILCVNREVNKTIVNATHLEHVLHAKLSTLCDCGICEQPGECGKTCWDTLESPL